MCGPPAERASSAISVPGNPTAMPAEITLLAVRKLLRLISFSNGDELPVSSSSSTSVHGLTPASHLRFTCLLSILLVILEEVLVVILEEDLRLLLLLLLLLLPLLPLLLPLLLHLLLLLPLPLPLLLLLPLR
jgi:hypothetical protein